MSFLYSIRTFVRCKVLFQRNFFLSLGRLILIEPNKLSHTQRLPKSLACRKEQTHMGQAYLLILIGILFTRLNFYVASIGIDFLPDLLGYLLTFIGLLKLRHSAQSRAYTAAKVLTVCFLLNECTKYIWYSSLLQHIVLTLIVSIVLMAAQIALYACILQNHFLMTGEKTVLNDKRRYMIIGSISILIYLYLCFFGGYLILMNLSALLETCYLFYVFLNLSRRSHVV